MAHYAQWDEHLDLAFGPDEYVNVVIVDDVGPFCVRPGGGDTDTPNGCARDHTVYTRFPVYGHEFIHAYSSKLGETVRFLEEGLAVVSECDGPVSSDSSQHTVDMVALASSSAFDALRGDDRLEAYAASGSFVAYVVDNHGWEVFSRVYQALGTNSNLSSVNAAFLAETGATFEEMVSRWNVQPAISSAEVCSRLVRLPRAPLTLNLTQTATCRTPWPEGSTQSINGIWGSSHGTSGSYDPTGPGRLSVLLEDHVGAVAQAHLTSPPFTESSMTANFSTPEALFVWDHGGSEYNVDIWDGVRFPTTTQDVARYLATAETTPPDPCNASLVDTTSLSFVGYSEIEPGMASGGPDAVLNVVSQVASLLVVNLPDGQDAWWCEDTCGTSAPCMAVADAPPLDRSYVLNMSAGTNYSFVMTRPQDGSSMSATLVVIR